MSETPDVNLKSRTIQVVGTIDEKMFCKVDTDLSLFEGKSKRPVTLIINSFGGSVYDAIAIVARMRKSPCDIITEVYGQVMSAATIILAAGDKRRMDKLAFFMTHEGSYGAGGTHTQIKHYVAQADRENKMWCKTMAEYSGVSAKFWETKGLNGLDLYLTAEQCLKIKVIDEVF